MKRAELEKADAALRIAVAADPTYHHAYNSLSYLLLATGRIDEGMGVVERGTQRATTGPILNQITACSLSDEARRHGWGLFERSHYASPQFNRVFASLSEPVWTGSEPVRGKTVLVLEELGLGGTIFFLRWLPKLASLGARIAAELARMAEAAKQ